MNDYCLACEKEVEFDETGHCCICGRTKKAAEITLRAREDILHDAKMKRVWIAIGAVIAAIMIVFSYGETIYTALIPFITQVTFSSGIIVIGIIAVMVWVAMKVMRTHSPSMFAARVSGALYDLGIDARKLDDYFKKKLEIERRAFYGASFQKPPNHKAFALRFFVFALIEYKRLPIGAIIQDAPLVTSIPIIKGWAEKGEIPAGIAETEINKIKLYLVDHLPSDGMTKEDRLEKEIQILEL